MVNEIRIWELASGTVISRIEEKTRGHYYGLSFHPDGNTLAASSPGRVKLWDVETGNELRAFPVEALHPVWVEETPGSGGGTKRYSQKAVTIRSTSSGHIERAWPIEGERSVRDLSLVGERLAFVTSWNGRPGDPPCQVRIRSLHTGQELLSLERPPVHRLWSVSLSFDGKRLAFGSGGRVKKVEVCDASSGETVHEFQARALHVAFDRDGRHLAGGGSWGEGQVEKVKVWDLNRGQEVFTFTVEFGVYGLIRDLAFSPDGSYLAAASGYAGLTGSVTIWDVHRGEKCAVLQEHGQVNSVVFSPDANRLVSGNEEGTLRLWDIITDRTVLTLRGNRRPVFDVSFCPEGRVLASAGRDGAIIVQTLAEALQDRPVLSFGDWWGGENRTPDRVVRMMGPEPAAELLGALESEDPEVRRAAALISVFTSVERETAGAALGEALEDADRLVRIYAACSMARRRFPMAQELIPRLVEALEDADAAVRLEAAEALGALGGVEPKIALGENVLAALRATRKDADPRVSCAADLSLEAIERGK